MTAIGTFILVPSFTQQTAGSSGLHDAIQSYSSAYTCQERLFVFLNSGFYYPGEDLSFKAVLFDADMKIMMNGSRFFYLQLMDNNSNSIANYTFELHSGECAGHFRIPDTLLTGLYSLKAFTRWMQCYSPDNAFRRPLLIISPLDGETIRSSVDDSLPAHFYPASGNFVAGAENEILIQMDPYRSHGIRNLNITDDLGDTILPCRIDIHGTGIFSLTPAPGRTYYAVVADSGQPQQIFKLPDQQNSGYCMNIKADKDYLNIALASAGEVIHDNAIFLAVMTGDAEKSSIVQVNMVDNRGKVSVPIDNLPAGLSQLALFSNNNVLCSRVWYRKREQPPTQVKTILPDTLGTRESMTALWRLPEAAEPEKVFAVSVNEYNPVTDSLFYDEIVHYRYFDLYSSLSQCDILPLFEETASEEYINGCLIAVTKTLAMDFVVHNSNKVRFVRETQGVVLTGKVISSLTGLPVKGASVLLSSPDSVAHINYSMTNERGEFFFTLNDKLYNKQLYITVQGYPQTGNPVSIIPDDPFSVRATCRSIMPLVHPSMELVINSHKNIAMAYRVFYGDKIRLSLPAVQMNPSYTVNYYGKPDFRLIPAEYESLPDLFEIRKNLIPGLKLKIENDHCFMSVFDDYLYLFPSYQAFVLLNNVPYPSLRNVLELNSDLIRSIEIKQGKLFYDNYLMYGIVSINTIKPMAVEPYYSYLTTMIKVTADTAETSSSQVISKGPMPDVRHSLYWETDSAYIAETKGIRFRSSDIKGKYQLKVFFIAADGSLHCSDKVFTVL